MENFALRYALKSDNERTRGRKKFVYFQMEIASVEIWFLIEIQSELNRISASILFLLLKNSLLYVCCCHLFVKIEQILVNALCRFGNKLTG